MKMDRRFRLARGARGEGEERGIARPGVDGAERIRLATHAPLDLGRGRTAVARIARDAPARLFCRGRQLLEQTLFA